MIHSRYLLNLGRQVGANIKKSCKVSPMRCLHVQANVKVSSWHLTTCRSSAVRYYKNSQRPCSSSASQVAPQYTPATKDFVEATDAETLRVLSEDFLLYNDFLSEAEEKSLHDEVHPHLRKMRYEKDHWDDAILNYRETERRNWTPTNSAILQRIRDIAFPAGIPQLSFVHVLDLAEEGEIKPHIDSIRFCGCTIAGVSLLSDSVMRLVLDKDKSKYADLLVKRRSLYIMTRKSRYDYTHEILGNEKSIFRGEVVPKTRRISVICRNEPDKDLLDKS